MMEPEDFSLDYGSGQIDYRVVRRNRKTLEIAVEPNASVVIAAPENASREAIEAKLRKRAAWVTRQQRFFAQFMPRLPERQFISGETHLYLGRQYRLKVIPHVQQAVKLRHGYFVVQTHRPLSPEVTQGLIEDWYRQKARAKFVERIELALTRFPDSELRRPQRLVVKNLKQRWGSMSPGANLVLNRRLIEAPVDAIDYVIVHELCHVTEPNHGTAFFDLLQRVMPDWQRRKHKLELAMA